MFKKKESIASVNGTRKLMESRVGQWMDEVVSKGKFPCGELYVSVQGRTVCNYKNKGIITTKGEEEAIYRMYSMSKPMTTVGAMMLFEEGKLPIDQPIYKYLGDKWKKENMKVIDLESAKQNKMVTVPCQVDITFHHLLTHTSGLCHGLSNPELKNPVDFYYSQVGLSGAETILLAPGQKGLPDLQTFCDKLAECPLLFQPGDSWHYSYGLELVGRAMELISGKSLQDFLKERLWSKIGMNETTFFLSKEQEDRLAPFYFSKDNVLVSSPTHFPTYCCASAGIFSTMKDYVVFSTMLLRGGVAENGTRILSPKTVDWMFQNHLEKDFKPCTVREISIDAFSNDVPIGYGFGLGGAVALNTTNILTSRGEYSWAGALNTRFWIDPEEDIVCVFLTSILEDVLPLDSVLRSIVYGALSETKGSESIQSKKRENGISFG